MICPGLASDHDPSTYGLPHSWDHRYEPPYSLYWFRWADLKPQSSQSPPPGVGGITGVSHHAQPSFL
jgi:hypothetical protein